MDRSFMYVLLSATIVKTVIGSGFTINIDKVITGNTNECGNNVTVLEDYTMPITFTSSRYISNASCTNVVSNTNITINIKYGIKLPVEFRGKDHHEGEWKCVFLRIVNADIKGSINGTNYHYTDCRITVKIRHNVNLTVTGSESEQSVTAKTNDLTENYYYYKPGEKIRIECKKDTDIGPATFKSGTLMVQFCFNDSDCLPPKKDNSTIIQDMNLYENSTSGVLYCIYISKFSEKYEARVEFRYNPALPKISEVGMEIRESKAIENNNIVFDGKVGETRTYECKNSEKTGSIYWEFCDSYNVKSCSGQYGTRKITQTITLKADNRGTVVKCVYTSYNVKKETKIVLYANNPPVLTISGRGLNLFNDSTPDTYVIRGEPGKVVGIRCSNQKTFSNKNLLYWKACADKTVRNCNFTNTQKSDFIDRYHTFKLEDNKMFLYCAFKNSRGTEISTKTTFIVLPEVPKYIPVSTTPAPFLPNTTPTRQTLANVLPSSNKPAKQPVAGPKPPVKPSYPGTASPAPGVTSPPPSSSSQAKPTDPNEATSISTIYIDMKSDYNKDYNFTNGETLKYICRVLTRNTLFYTVEYKIKLISSDGIFSVPLEVCGYYSDDVKVCRGFYKMNFTSHIVNVTCHSIVTNLLSSITDYTKTITLTRRKSPDLLDGQILVTKKGSNDKVSHFKNGETLVFTCSYPDYWDYWNLEIELYTDDDPVVNLKFAINNEKKESWGSYTMNFTSKNIEVYCYRIENMERNRSVRKVLTRVEGTETTSNATTTNATTGSLVTNFLNNTTNLIWLAVAGGICVVMIIVACMVKAIKKGKHHEEMIQRASVDYEHFTNESQAPTPPFPVDAKLEQTYLAPLDLMESPYATYRPQQQDSETYALPYTPSTVEELYTKPVPKNSRINVLYTQVVPKSLRKNQDSSKYVNAGGNDELNYAQIGHKNIDVSKQTYANLEENSKNKVIVEDNYATIAHGNQDYANLNKDNKTNVANGRPNDQYTNVFNNDPYVNAKREDYAEPSYCELSRKH